GDALEFVDGGDHLGGDGVALRRHAQQHLQEFDRGATVRRGAEALHARQRFRIAFDAALDRFDDLTAPARALEALRQRAQMAEPLDRRRRLHGDVGEHLVLQDTRARHVARLRLALAPGRDLDEYAELLRFAHAALEPFPGAFRIG